MQNGNGRHLLSKEQILAVDDLGGELIEVPEWGGAVRLAVLSIARSNQLFGSELEGVDARVRILAACMVDERGQRLFSEGELAELSKKSMAVIQRLYLKAVEINGLTLKAVEADVKNSASGPGADSNSGSQQSSE